MIEVKIDENGIAFRAGNADLKRLTVEMCGIVNALYSRLKCSAAPELGNQFREAMIAAVTMPGSPLWNVAPGDERSYSVLVQATKKDGA